MSKYKRLGNNTLLVFIGNIGSKLIALFMLPFYTTWLSVEDYGVSDIVMIYASFFLGIITLSISESIFIFPKDQITSVQKKYFSSGLFFTLCCFLVTAVLFFIANRICFFFDISNTFTRYTWVIYLVILAMFLQQFLQQFTRSIDKLKVYASSGIILTLCIAFFAFMLIPKYGVLGFIYGQIISYFLTFFYSFIASKSYSYLSKKFISKISYKEMIIYSAPLIPNGIMWWLVSSVNRPIMEASIGVYAIGIFAVANKFPSIVSMVYTVFANSWQISVLEEFKKEGFQNFYNKVLQIIFSFIIVASCLITILSEKIVIFFADEKFLDAWRLIPILTLAILFSSLSSFVGTVFSAVRQSKYYFYSSIFGAIASVLFNLILIPFLGIIGAAIAVVLSHLVMALVRIIYSWKFVEIENYFRYINMIIINLIVIFVALNTELLSIKISAFIVSITLLLFINRNLKSNFIQLIQRYKK